MDETTSDEELFNAIKAENENEVQNLLRQRANVRAKDWEGNTVLHLAARDGQENVIKTLIRVGEWKDIVNTKCSLGRTALHNCSMKGHTKIAELLLGNGADITAADDAGWTALHLAAGEGHLATVKILVSHKTHHDADYNQKTNTTGATALHIAADRGFAGIVNELMNQRASITAIAWDGGTVLHWALDGAITAGRGRDGDGQIAEEDDNHSNVVNDEDDDYGNDEDDDPQTGRLDLLGTNDKDRENQFDAVIERILKDMDKSTKWSELVKVARREENEETLQFLMSKMFPQSEAKKKWRPLKRIWLAMREAKSGELAEMLRQDIPEDKSDMKTWDELRLATSLGKFQTVHWLLRSRRWPKSYIDTARNLSSRVVEHPRLSKEEQIWTTPFVQDERSAGESYRHPTRDLDDPNLDRYGATIMDFHKIGDQIVSVCYDCDPWNLIYKMESGGPEAVMMKATESLTDHGSGSEPPNGYSDASRCYRWIYLAANSLYWMKDLAMNVYLEKSANRAEWMATWQFLRRSWQELPENKDEETYMRPQCLRADVAQPKLTAGEQSATPKHEESIRLALYMPYITFGPFSNTSVHDKHLSDAHEGRILHKSRTLDQFHHGTIDDSRARDRDQVFTRFIDRKMNSKRKDGKVNTDFQILRINQLWLWVIDKNTVITSTTHRLDESEDPMFQGMLKRLSQSQTTFDRGAMPSSVDSFVKLLTSFYINALDNLAITLEVSSAQSTGSNRNPSTLIDPSAQLNDATQDAQQENPPAQQNDTTQDAQQKNPIADTTKTFIASLTRVFADSIEHNNEEERKLRQKFRDGMKQKSSRSKDLHGSIVQAMLILDDIKDIRDELNIIDSVVQEQKSVWAQVFNLPYGPHRRDDSAQLGHEISQWSNTDPEYVLKRVKDLLQNAEETERNITSVLELEMNQLNVQEAEETRMQGKILMIFTVVTVLFLPLSFLSSLFALNVASFPHSGNDLQYQPGWIFGIIFGLTAGFILLLLPFTVLREALVAMVKHIIVKLEKPNSKAPPDCNTMPRDKEKTKETVWRLQSLLWWRRRGMVAKNGNPAQQAV